MSFREEVYAAVRKIPAGSVATYGEIALMVGRPGVEREGEAKIINLKFDKGQAMDFAEGNEGIFPAYHMNKNNWITVVLDGTVADGVVMELVRKSYLVTG